MKADASRLITAMLPRLDWGWGLMMSGRGDAQFVKANVSLFRLNTQLCSVLQPFNKKDTFHHPSCILFSRSILTWLLYYTSIKVKIHREWVHQWTRFALMKSKVCESDDMPAQEYHCWVDCAKMTCCIGFFFFLFSSIYMLLYKQRGLWRRVMKCWR